MAVSVQPHHLSRWSARSNNHLASLVWSPPLNLHLYLRLLRSGAWIIVFLVLLGSAAGAAGAYLTPPTYGAQATVYVRIEGATSAGELQAGNVYVQQKLQTLASLASTRAVLKTAAESLGEGTTVDALQGAVVPSAVADSGIITLSGSGSNPRQVAERTNAVGAALVEFIAASDEQPVPTSGSNRTASSQLEVAASIAQPATVPIVAVAPQPRYAVFAGVVVGLALALALIVLRYALDTRIHRLTDLPTDRTLVARTSIPPSPGRFTRKSNDEVQLESFRALRATLQFGSDLGRSIAVAPVGHEGDARWVAVELCRVFAETGQKVLLVDADLRPVAEERRGDSEVRRRPVPGLAQILSRTVATDEALTTLATEGGALFSIPAGVTTDRSSQLLSTPAMQETLASLEQSYSAVVLICPPLVERADATVVAALASSTLVVVRGASTKRAQLRFALGLLAGVHARSVSVVLENAQVS